MTIWKISLIIVSILIFIFFISEIANRMNQPDVSEHTIYCYEICRQMVLNRDSPYFNIDNGWTHCVDDCGGYDE